MSVEQVRICKGFVATIAFVRLGRPRAGWMFSRHMSLHSVSLICTSLEVTSLVNTTDHGPPLLLLDSLDRFEPAKRTSHCCFEMYPLHMTSLLVFVPEIFTTTLTLVTLVVVPLKVADELLLTLEAPSAVALPAEERSDNVVLAMKPHGWLVNCLISTDPTGEVLRGGVTIPLMS